MSDIPPMDVTEDEIAISAQEEQDARDAVEIIRDTLRQYGLEDLTGEAYNMLIDGSSTEAVVLRLRESERFRERFAGMELRREARVACDLPRRIHQPRAQLSANHDGCWDP